MAVSPRADRQGDLFVEIHANGVQLADTVTVLSVEITTAVNRIPLARIVLHDDSDTDAAPRFAVSDGAALAPGAGVVIKAGYGAARATLFEGIVIRHGMRIASFGQGRLVVECRDKAVALTVGRKCANFVDLKDSDIIKKLASAGGLAATVADTTATHKELVQYDVSDWDFLLARAEANGLVVLASGGKLAVAAPDVKTAPALCVTYGKDLNEFEGDLDARHQLAAVTGVGWDPATQEIVEQRAEPPSLNAHGNLDAAALAKVIGLKAWRLQSPLPLDTDGLKAWTAARQLKAALARVRGRMRFLGSALALPGTLMEVAGTGTRFAGQAWLSSVTHLISDGDWSTEAEFGLAPEALAERQSLAAPLAGGLTAGVTGLQIGVVLKLNEDPAQQHKVQVALPVTQAETAGVWARLASGYGSSGVGSFFIPEVGDEVLLGFLDSDPSHPVILGSLYSSKRAPPYALTAENNTKAIVTRSKLTIEFDEEKKVITVRTPGRQSVVLSDDAKSIVLEDQTGNKVTLSPDGIALDSPKDIAITAKGKITLAATGEIGITSAADLTQSAMNIASTAKAGFSAKGASSAELSASGQTTVKGAMVMIN
ncbi:type VI secretion system tip protein VgrG [Pseudoduganella chitinolytica]|uniref:Type VI secretion system tip protein VgrG n=1 Tax=Pseudoduganella chitinolytica TaxID=34070 RepID=A0ABY8BEG7_9BURK|nr:type VI secretion system tip protein VgrG [Pseudoduganella chitinolytica]WEF34306.1 type VI secretion system tip protein VgrG [Pseudoduganella chitinolytica]